MLYVTLRTVVDRLLLYLAASTVDTQPRFLSSCGVRVRRVACGGGVALCTACQPLAPSGRCRKAPRQDTAACRAKVYDVMLALSNAGDWWEGIAPAFVALSEIVAFTGARSLAQLQCHMQMCAVTLCPRIGSESFNMCAWKHAIFRLEGSRTWVVLATLWCTAYVESSTLPQCHSGVAGLVVACSYTCGSVIPLDSSVCWLSLNR